VGLSAAKALAYGLDIPFVGVNHLEGHITASFLAEKKPQFPFAALVVSGGHTNVYLVKNYHEFQLLGQTRDDAAGEAFDKAAKLLDLGYPGGVVIDKMAKTGNPGAFVFPRAMKDSPDFSFSGLKSAVLNYLNGKKMKNEPIEVDDVAASFQMAVIEVLVTKTIACAKSINMKTICMAGGVSCNSLLRKMMSEAAEKEGLSLYYPDPILCTDNAAMIGSMAYYNFINGGESDLSLNGIPGLKIGTRQ